MSPDTIHILYLFSGYWQIGMCSFAFAALLAIWHHISRRQALQQRDPGLVWLAMSILVWVFVGWVDVMQGQQPLTLQESEGSLTFDGLRSMLSILNSAFILLALPRFRHTPALVRPIIRSDSWKWLVILGLIFALVLTLMMLAGWIIPSRYSFIYSIDLIYAIFTLFFLGLVLWTSFAKRGLPVLAILSALSIVLTLLAQILKLSDPLFYKILSNGVFKSVFIMLFFALALSWVEEISQGNWSALPEEMFLVFLPRRVQQKMEYNVILTVRPFFQTTKLSLTEKNYQLLRTFADRRREEGPTGGWLEIQPKSSNRKDYDINDYNEINRLLDNLLQSAQSASTSEQKKQLKDVLFEYGKQRRIRLRMAGQNITPGE